MTKINEALNKETLEDVQAVFANAIEDIKEKFEGAVVEAYQKGVTHGMTLGMSVEHTKPKYKTEKRKAKVGERVLIVEEGPEEFSNVSTVGDVVTVRIAMPTGSLITEEYGDYIMPGYYEVIVDEPVKEPTPNQQRAALIEKAKEFVEAQKVKRGTSRGVKIVYIAPCSVRYYCNADFVVNEDKNTVVCLLKALNSKDVKAKGIAKCMPDEVFNADIGKAIALARALEIDVPEEFLNSVQPDEAEIGMLVHPVNENTKENVFTNPKKVKNTCINEGKKCPMYDGSIAGWASHFNILNDTNAQYEVSL